ncbi:hypothetical protein [Nonomuraea polychroma]|uniref:rhamnogalacturonan endolyase family protein n=1 Tax=Nonomuraea polychroma TaxID=46176 RepID=UPI0019D41E28|nr:hypothetical protein [Nonomuraea polychroma]
MERLDRGLVATTTPRGVFLSWCLLGTEVTGAGPGGRLGADFRVYRDGRPIATVTDSTNYLDPVGTPTFQYSVAPPWGRRSAPTSAFRESFYDVPLHKPADGLTPAGEAYTYAANDMSVGDANGDGRSEVMLKTAPGTRVIRYDAAGNPNQERFVHHAAAGLRAHRRLPAECRGLLRPCCGGVHEVARASRGGRRSPARHPGASLRHHPEAQLPTLPPGRPPSSPPASSTSTHPPAPATTACGSSPASSSPAPDTCRSSTKGNPGLIADIG